MECGKLINTEKPINLSVVPYKLIFTLASFLTLYANISNNAE